VPSRSCRKWNGVRCDRLLSRWGRKRRSLTIHDAEPESPLELAHDEDIGGWSAKIENCLIGCGGAIGFWAIVRVTGLAPVEVLLVGGLAIDWEEEGDFYGGVVVRF
jgi:hypothetical protein